MADRLMAPTGALDLTKSYAARFKTERGEFAVELFAADAPMTVENFVNLARAGFYDGTTFHRVIPGFMIQGGDPNSKDADRSNDGMGGSGTNVPAEFNANKHLRGTVSMARAQDPNSASCQFFICVKPTPFLDSVARGVSVAQCAGSDSRSRRPYGVFKNQGDCVSLVAPAG